MPRRRSVVEDRICFGMPPSGSYSLSPEDGAVVSRALDHARFSAMGLLNIVHEFFPM